jgi:hypothetical protein
MNQTGEVFFCLTWRGTILTRDQNGMPFLNETMEMGVPANAARFTLHCDSAGSKLGITARLLPGSPPIASAGSAHPPAFQVIPAGHGRAVYLHLGKQFAAIPENGVLVHGKPRPDKFAVFIFVPERELRGLLFVRDNQWLTGTGALIRQGETGFRRGFVFSFGPDEADLRHGPGFAGTWAEAGETGPYLSELTLLRDGWKITGQLRLFRPLIYYAAFGRQEIFEQLRWSLRSLNTFGAYAGAVHIISDQPKSFILPFVPPELRGRLTIQPLTGMDFWDFCFARMRLHEWPHAEAFQPLLYVDTDIAFDRPVEALLKNIALSGNICVGRESWAKLATDYGVGGRLFQEAGVEMGDARGFNSGCQGFANLDMARRYFGLTLQVAESYGANHPGGFAQFGDQPFANYVAVMSESVDTASITPVMRLSHQPLGAAADDRQGLVHFWPSRGEGKSSAMRAYVEAMEAAENSAPEAEISAVDAMEGAAA